MLYIYMIYDIDVYIISIGHHRPCIYLKPHGPRQQPQPVLGSWSLLNPVFCPFSLFFTIPSNTIELTPYFSVPVYSVDLIDAFPIATSAIELNNELDGLVQLTVTFAYTNWKRSKNVQGFINMDISTPLGGIDIL